MASMNDLTHLIEDTTLTVAWACEDCGAAVIDRAGDPTNRLRHEKWHNGVNRSINELSPDFAGY
jgi:hypothetical protein